MPTTTSATATIERLQTTYGPQAVALGQTAASFYNANLTLFEVISVLFSVFFITATVYILIKTGFIGLRVDRIRHIVLKKDTTKRHVKSSWDDIERHFFAGNDNDLRIALIEADNLLDVALRDTGIQGTQLGERLKKVRDDQLPNIEDVWQAHKLRNRIAHETGFVLKRDLAERALTIYEAALRHLGFLPEEGDITTTQSRSPQ